MSEHFLEEQLKRIKEMTEQMARLRSRAAELCEAFDRERLAGRHDALHEVRDFRMPSSELPPPHDRADEHASRQHQSRHPRSRRK